VSSRELLERARAAGVILWRDGERLRWRGQSEVVAALLPDLAAHKAELMRLATDSELKALVCEVAFRHGFTDEQRQEALQIALGDAVAAIECFRTLVKQRRLTATIKTGKSYDNGY